jgi:hypothetical protein
MPPTSPLHTEPLNLQYSRQAFHQPRTSVGAAGHWVKTAGILSPLLIHEMIKDPEQRWRWIRIGSVATAVLSEILWTNRIHKEREGRAARQEQGHWER